MRRGFGVVVVLVLLLVVAVGLVFLDRIVQPFARLRPSLFSSSAPFPPDSQKRGKPEIVPSNISPKWVLVRVDKATQSGIISFNSNEYFESPVRWGDYLFWGEYSSDRNGNKAQINRHNIRTGVTDKVFRDGDETEKARLNRDISSIQLIDQTLFISLGGYLRDGATFWMDSPAGQAKFLAGSRNGKIKKIGNHHFLVGGDGDACWGFTTYSLVDLNLKKVTPVVEIKGACERGENFIAIDRHERFIISGYEWVSPSHPTGGGFGGSDSTVEDTYIYAVPVFNSTVKEGVIARQDMPKNISSLAYVENDDSLIMLSQTTVYKFPLASGKLTKLTDLPRLLAQSYSLISIEEKTCLWTTKKEGGQNVDIRKLDTDTGQASNSSRECSLESLENLGSTKKSLEKVIGDLGLPENYHLVKE